jgi:hypothetical protein
VVSVPADADPVTAGGRAVGMAAITLSVITIALISFAAPWQIRFPVLIIAVLFGPGIPLLRLNSHLSIGECVVYGIGTNVSLQMLVGLLLVLAHTWAPAAATIGLLVVSGLAGIRLVMNARTGDR